MLLGVLPVCLVAILAQPALSRKLPSYIQVCKQSDPNFEQCAKDSFEKARPYLAQGIPKLKMPALEPLSIPQLQIDRDQENIKLKATLKDVKAFGGSNFIIEKMKPDFEKNTVEGRLRLPLLYVEADYDVDGRVLLIPVRGKGHFIGNISDVVADYKASGDVATNTKGVKHLVIKDIKVKVRVNGDPIINIKNTDGDGNNKLLTTTAVNFYNQNKKQVMDVITPIIEETSEAFAIQLGNQVLKSIPYDEILPA